MNYLDYLIFWPIPISFIITLVAMPLWIRKVKGIGLVWEDMNKFKQEKNVAGSGGLIVLFGFIIGVFCYIAIKTFYFQNSINFIEGFALIATILIAGLIGLVDDFFGWAKGGLSARMRVFLMLIASIPLMVINAGTSQVSIPFFGSANIGILYASLVIPIGIIGASTTFNFLAGYNGLEAGQGILILSALAVFSWITGTGWLSIVALCMIAALFAFLLFNRYPAKVFPGDVLTYPVGALIAVMAILGNYEYFAIFIFIPYILEVILKLRGNLKVQSFGIPQKDGSLESRPGKVCGLENLVIRILKRIKPSRKVYEFEVVLFINLFQVLIIILGFIIFMR